MRLIDLENLQIVSKSKNEVQVLSAGYHRELMDMEYNVGVKVINMLCEDIIAAIKKDYVCFEIEFIDNTIDNLADEQHVAYLVSSLLITNLTTNELRDRESRLDVPKRLDKVTSISRVSYLKAINYKTAVKGFCGFVSINGHKYYLLGSH